MRPERRQPFGGDGYNLERFVMAQDAVYDQVRSELRAGAKRSHWMWFVFPQLEQLGQSPTAKHFGIASLDEAKAYWQHPVLGPRLAECTKLVVTVDGTSASQIFGYPDDLKFRSSMTLFEQAAPHELLFSGALQKYFPDGPDQRTLDLLRV
jgi:uncharacterized protein (DUF1810 family)